MTSEGWGLVLTLAAWHAGPAMPAVQSPRQPDRVRIGREGFASDANTEATAPFWCIRFPFRTEVPEDRADDVTAALALLQVARDDLETLEAALLRRCDHPPCRSGVLVLRLMVLPWRVPVVAGSGSWVGRPTPMRSSTVRVMAASSQVKARGGAQAVAGQRPVPPQQAAFAFVSGTGRTSAGMCCRLAGSASRRRRSARGSCLIRAASRSCTLRRLASSNRFRARCWR